MGLLDALIFGIRDVFDSMGVSLPRRSRIKLRNNITVTDDPVRDLILVDVIAEGAITPPGGDDTEFQWNNANSFDGSVGMTYDLANSRPNMVNGWYLGSGTDRILFTGTPSGANTWTWAAVTDQVVGRATSDNLTNKTLTSPVVAGTPIYQGTHASIKNVVGEVTTSSTSATTVASYAMTDETHAQFDAIITYGRKTATTKAATYKRSVAYRRTSGGAPTIVGSLVAGTDQETTSADDVTIDVSSNTVRVRVTAADSDDRYWMCDLRIQEVIS
jgi:hypothetical protein